MANESVMDKITGARSQIQGRVADVRAKISGGKGGSGSRLLMGGAGSRLYGDGQGGQIKERIEEIRTSLQTRLKSMGRGRMTGRFSRGADTGGGNRGMERKVESPSLPARASTGKVIRV